MMLDENNQWLRGLLQDEEVQARVQENIRRGQADVKVTIGRAAELFQMKASKLRELDKLLLPERPKDTTEQRQYSLTELNKLAIISVLFNSKGVPLNDIPENIDEIWAEIASVSSVPSTPHERNNSHKTGDERDVSLSVDKRVVSANNEAFWRYFISQALMLSLNLIFEDIPDPVVGIILPLNRKTNATSTWEPEHVDQLGECLIGWRDKNRSYTTFYTPAPKFDFHTDFRISGLQAKDEPEPQDKTFVVLQRDTMALNLSLPVIDTIRRLLAPIYENIAIWKPYFDRGMKDDVYTIIPPVGTTIPDTMLTEFADMAACLGGKMSDGQDRWKFCAILLPDTSNPSLSLQQRSLVVQAQSSRSPHAVGKTKVSPDIPNQPVLSLSLRAFQSIRVLYRPLVSTEDKAIEYRDKEAPIQSAIALPIEGKDGLPIGLLYLVSEYTDAFDREYQQLLRLISIMIGKLLDPSRNHTIEGLREVVMNPQIVNKMLGAFLSENDFVKDVEDILRPIFLHQSPSEDDVTSFISVDVDNLSNLTAVYGNQVLVNLSKALGTRIEEQIVLLLNKPVEYKLYHVYADRFYLLINNMSLKQARENAEKLRQALSGNYSIAILPTMTGQFRSRVDLEGITVRLGVSSYKHTKFLKLLKERSAETCITDVVSGCVLYYLDFALNSAKQGQSKGNCIFSYYPPDPPRFEHSRFDLWTPPVNEEETIKT